MLSLDSLKALVPETLDEDAYERLHRLITEYPILETMLSGGLDLVDCLTHIAVYIPVKGRDK